MLSVGWRLLVSVALAAIGVVAVPAVGDAQSPLSVEFYQDPVVCSGSVKEIGVVSGFAPGEAVQFSSPQLGGVFSNRTADAAGRVVMRWNCAGPQQWSVTVTGLGNGSSASFTVTGVAAPPPPTAPVGAAFDAKSAMSTAQMAAWKAASPFTTVGIYIPVSRQFDNRADKIQANLSAGWVSQVLADGWRILPIYVGLQAPDRCATARYEGIADDAATARGQGLQAAADAVASVGRLGIGAGSPIYYDMEAYRPGCSAAVIAFLDAWTEGVHAAGYLSGVYGSRSSTMWDLSRSYGTPGFDPPDAVWVSTGNGQASPLGLEIPADGLWTNARIHQYRLNVTRTYGGVTLEIDENIVNAPTAGYSAPVVVGVDSDGDGFAEPNPDNCDGIANPDQADLDGDGDGDACDSDIDGDGVANESDFAPRDASRSTAPAPTAASTTAPALRPTVAATTGPTVVDSDGDGFAEPSPDNCDRIANPDQADLDGDGDGDACDTDIDGDGVPNESDSAPRDRSVSGSANAAPDPSAAPTTDADPTAEPVDLSTPTPTLPLNETSDEDLIAIPVPTSGIPTSTSTPEPSVTPTAEPSVTPTAQVTDPSADPLDGSGPADAARFASDMVTITVDEQGSALPWAIGVLAAFSMFCAGMGVRSFNRRPL